MGGRWVLLNIQVCCVISLCVCVCASARVLAEITYSPPLSCYLLHFFNVTGKI